MRADAVLMLLPIINSSSLDSVRNDSTASQGASLAAKNYLQASLAPKCLSSQQPAANVQWDTDARPPFADRCAAGCWLLEHFQRIKKSCYPASAGRRIF